MPTLPNMSLITPTLGGDSGTWDDKINAAFELVDSHDHTAGKGVQVPISALNINADLPLAGYGITGLSKATFSAIALPSSGALNLFVSSTDNELYWRSSGGTNVKLTSGASINTTLVGGITGDYSTVGAEIAYDDANKRYTFQTQTATWARLATGPVRIYEYNTTENVYVEHAVDATLAAPYTVTWPAALPASQSLLQITAAGVVLFSNTLTERPTAPDYQYTEDHFSSSPTGFLGYDLGAAVHTHSQSGWTLASSISPLFCGVIPEGTFEISTTVTGWGVRIRKVSADTCTLQAKLFRVANGVTQQLGTTQTISSAAPGYVALGETGGISDIVDPHYTYYVRFESTAGNPAGDEWLTAWVRYKRS